MICGIVGSTAICERFAFAGLSKLDIESWPHRLATQFMCACTQSNIGQPRNFRNFAICALRRLILVLGGVDGQICYC